MFAVLLVLIRDLELFLQRNFLSVQIEVELA
jgi:hypothetical protein